MGYRLRVPRFMGVNKPEESHFQRRAALVVLWAIGLTSAVRAAAIARSYFWQDDYIHIWRAWNFRASDLILGVWNGHFEPIGMAYLWAITRVAPQNWAPAAAYLILLSVAIPLAFWRLVTTFRGVTMPAAAATILFAVWPGLLAVETWFSAGLQLTWLLCAFVSIWAVFRQLPVWVPGLALALGCLSNERALFTVPLAFTAMVLFREADSTRDRVVAVWKDRQRYWVLLSCLTVALTFLISVVTRPWAAMRGADVARPWSQIWRGPLEGTLRGVLALPSGWGERGTFPVAVPGWQVWVTIVATVCVLVLAWRRNRQQALVSVLLIGCWLFVEPVLVMLTRSDFLNSGSSMLLADARFGISGSVVILMAVAAWRNATPDAERTHAIAWSQSAAGWVLVPIIVLALSDMLGAVRMSDGARSRSWLATARANFVGSEKPQLVSTSSPPFMLNSFFLAMNDAGNQYEQGTTRTLLAVGAEEPVFGKATDFPLGADVTGNAAAVTVFPVRSQTPTNFGAECSVQLTGDWKRIPMTPTGLGNPIVSLDILTSQPVDLEIRLGSWHEEVRAPSGLRSVYFFPEPGPFDGFDVRANGPGGVVCLGSARAGQPFVIMDP